MTIIAKTCPLTGFPCDSSACSPTHCSKQVEFHPVMQHGWVCPICGRGNAPWNTTCPCGPPIELKVTC